MNPEELDPQTKNYLNQIKRITRSTLKSKMEMYQSFTEFSTATRFLSFKKRTLNPPQSLPKQLPQISYIESKKTKKLSKSEKKSLDKIPLDQIKKRTIESYQQQEQKKEQRNTILKKQYFLNRRYTIQFTKSEYIKNGGVLFQEKKLLCDQVQNQFYAFSKNCKENSFQNAIEIFINFLNYTIDLNLLKEFATTLFYISQFSLIFGDYKKAIFFFEQCRQCSRQLLNYPMLIDTYIGLAKCCIKINNNQNGIIFLKKALEYTWHINDKQKQLIIYDQIGIQYYRLGDLQKSRYFHERFAQTSYEREDSAVKMMVRTRVRDEQKMLQLKVPTNINVVFLVSLNIPVKPLEKLANINKNQSIRKQHTNYVDFQQTGDDVNFQIAQILQQKQFEDEMPQPRYQQNQKYVARIEESKNNFPEIDFHLNRRLLKYMQKTTILDKRKSLFKPKLNLDEKVIHRLKEQQLEQDWYIKLVKKIMNGRHSNLSSLRSKVLIRGAHIIDKIPFQYYVSVYNTYFIEMLF